MPNQQFQTISIPTVGEINFPSDMNPDQIRDAIYKNYPHLAPTEYKMQHPSGLEGMPLPGVPKAPSVLDKLPSQKELQRANVS